MIRGLRTMRGGSARRYSVPMTASVPVPGTAPVRRIAAVDDHELSLRGFASVIGSADDLELVGMFPTVDALLAELGTAPGAELGTAPGADPEHSPALDLVVLDLRLGDDSDPAANVLKLQQLTGNILILSSLESPFLVRRALQAGVLGMMPKSESSENLLAAIREAAAGRPVLTTEWAAVIDSDPNLSEVDLSPRQQEVLELYASGEPAKRVARMTGLAQDTVNDYLGRIRVKYKAAGRTAQTKTDLLFRAQEDGYLPGPTDPDIP